MITITTRDVGVHFGTAGVIKQGRKILWEGEPRPYGFTESALRDACNEALRRGGQKLGAARAAESAAFEEAAEIAAAAWNAGMSEVEIARLLGVDRMTVRKWRGKR